MKVEAFGTDHKGRSITAYTLEGGDGAFLEVLDYGGKVVRLVVPDRTGKLENVALSLSFAKPGFGGSLIGRYANRISRGKFVVDGREYETPTNIEPDGIPALLHGGAEGFHDKIWAARPFTTADAECVELTLTSPDGEGGFPGKLEVKVVYSFTRDNVWRIEWTATTDKATPINFTHHVYFNLHGENRKPIADEMVTLASDYRTPCGKGATPTGDLESVAATDYDFRNPVRVDARLEGRYDLNYALRGQDGTLAFAARVDDAESGRRLDTWTTEPGIQLYTGFAFNDTLKDQFERTLFPFAGLALETQHYPDSVNHPNFPNTLLRPGEVYSSVTEYRFTTI